MLTASAPPRFAMIGGVRIPFWLSSAAWALGANRDRLTAALRGHWRDAAAGRRSAWTVEK